jgi:hypothetical protein
MSKLKFVLIDPRDCSVRMVEAESPNDIYENVGLRRNEVDFGCVYKSQSEGWSINIIVDEFGMYKPVDEAKYFSLGGQLISGGCIMFRADDGGETISMNALPPVMFYRSAAEVEEAITRGEIVRPRMLVNEELIWEWPQPRRI